MDLDSLPAQLRPVLNALAAALRSREPAIRERVAKLRAEHPHDTPDQLARRLISRTRRRVAATGAASGAAAIAPGLGTLIALGTVTSQGLYALEQETELVLAIAIIYGHELAGSDERLLEALLVVGLAGGAVKLRENVLVAGGERLTVAALRTLPARTLTGPSTHLVGRVLARVLGRRAVGAVVRVAPLAVGMAAGAGFDWFAVTALGRAAIRYYGSGGPALTALPPHGEDRVEIERGG
ncbi:MAG TPA: hypothetical protein VF160_03370 [Candidatus Dormibacteraeota bacterium]